MDETTLVQDVHLCEEDLLEIINTIPGDDLNEDLRDGEEYYGN